METKMKLPRIKCPKCGHIASFVTLEDETGYCMYCCRTTPLNELEMMERAVTAQIGCHGFVDSFVQCDRCRFQYLPQACKKWRDDNEGVVVVG